jgi:ribosomal-protein-alanine N-acetyltransferase
VSSSGIAVRTALASDLELMAAMHTACFARSWSASEIAPFVDRPGCMSLLASPEAEGPRGLLIVRSAGDEAEILTLAVDPSRRRQGLARALLAAAIAALQQAGTKRLFLEVEADNVPARRLYLSLGAAAVGHRARYYEHGGDADIFCLAL